MYIASGPAANRDERTGLLREQKLPRLITATRGRKGLLRCLRVQTGTTRESSRTKGRRGKGSMIEREGGRDSMREREGYIQKHIEVSGALLHSCGNLVAPGLACIGPNCPPEASPCAILGGQGGNDPNLPADLRRALGMAEAAQGGRGSERDRNRERERERWRARERERESGGARRTKTRHRHNTQTFPGSSADPGNPRGRQTVGCARGDFSSSR
ncbi:unnamed protein product [Prorocentrum cordatum]|uniref:Uncharacterized protein n=1 Tax=Prorocentrum cordatum TaxID=2364126 RepID=A0ABN9Q3S4_9DINO|nr:unnamed protein product [Polarella glacialis]